ncbi:MarR family winged helix-turn-helix transcriptional regulator [uncultured Nocardioides sp.]|uniref:MarR family winged helix-turn-helix transcriptional regulator n=1 Tax=uncultured Nocardioides sp. TaxID=198441 RepID=UPI002636666B|nr:MarR family winged helix-turn-helix transcriptional regulator [uncultured Nocardioides sp.]
MTENDPRDELQRLVQLLVTEGSKVVDDFAAAHGLHRTDVEALTHVQVAEARGTPLTAGVLAAELGRSTGSTTAVVDRLVRAGHLVRERDDADRRRVLVRYSPAGRALADAFFDPLRDRTRAAMDGLGPAELEVVDRFLRSAVTAMGEHRRSLGSSAVPVGAEAREAGRQ